MDHKVPVVDIRGAGGKRLAILFGYTCHNTTLGADATHLSGDYAGAAQREIEAKYPGTTALFLLLCGADQNPNPRGKPEQVEAYGQQLAAAVSDALDEAFSINRFIWPTTRRKRMLSCQSGICHALK